MLATSSGANHTAVFQCSYANAYAAVLGNHTNGGTAIYAQSNTTNNTGGNAALVAVNTSSGDGIYASSLGTAIRCGAGYVGVEAHAGANIFATGVSGFGDGDGLSIGVRGYAGLTPNATGAHGVDGGTAGSVQNSCYAGYFAGAIAKTGSAFLIDHPLDPANKYLMHWAVESPEMKNLYDGMVTVDASGVAEIQVPDWFDALNTDLRYQLTAVGGPAPGLHVKEKMNARRFVIAGAQPGQEVCWQVTGTRKDPWAVANAVPVEREKVGIDKGFYRHPEVYGLPRSKAIGELWRNAGPNVSSNP